MLTFSETVKSGCILLVAMQVEGNWMAKQGLCCGQVRELFILSVA